MTYKQGLSNSFDNSAFSETQRVPAFPDSVKPGTLIYYKPGLIDPNHSKPHEIRPGLVMAVWRDANGGAVVFEVAYITSNKSAVYAQDLDSSFPFFYEQIKVGGNNSKVDLKNLMFLPNDERFVKSASLTAHSIIKTLWPDLLVRRAFSLLWKDDKIILGNRPDKSLTRDGFAFGNIQEEHVAGKEWQPDLLDNGYKHSLKRDTAQDAIDAIARFANIYSAEQHRAGKIFNFPHHNIWPKIIPPTQFTIHKSDRRFSVPKKDLHRE